MELHDLRGTGQAQICALLEHLEVLFEGWDHQLNLARSRVTLGPDHRLKLVYDLVGDEVLVHGVEVQATQTTEPVEVSQRPGLPLNIGHDRDEILSRFEHGPDTALVLEHVDDRPVDE